MSEHRRDWPEDSPLDFAVKEMQELHDQYERGEITLQEFAERNKPLKEMVEGLAPEIREGRPIGRKGGARSNGGTDDGSNR